MQDTQTEQPTLRSRTRDIIRWSQTYRSPHVKVEGIKTIGVHIPASMRQRIKAVEGQYNLKSYRDAVYLCILAGLESLDTHS